MKLLASHSDYRGRDWPGIRSVQILNGRLSASLHNVENRTKTRDRSFSFLPYKSCPFSRAWHVCHSAAALHLHEASSLWAQFWSDCWYWNLRWTGFWSCAQVRTEEVTQAACPREWVDWELQPYLWLWEKLLQYSWLFQGMVCGAQDTGNSSQPWAREARGGPTSHQLGESWRPWATHNVLLVLFLWHETGMWTPVGLERFLVRHKW